jgi:hypothetical protein
MKNNNNVVVGCSWSQLGRIFVTKQQLILLPTRSYHPWTLATPIIPPFSSVYKDRDS